MLCQGSCDKWKKNFVTFFLFLECQGPPTCQAFEDKVLTVDYVPFYPNSMNDGDALNRMAVAYIIKVRNICICLPKHHAVNLVGVSFHVFHVHFTCHSQSPCAL